MSNMLDAMGLCIPYGRADSQYQTQFEPATGTIWGYFNPRGVWNLDRIPHDAREIFRRVIDECSVTDKAA